MRDSPKTKAVNDRIMESMALNDQPCPVVKTGFGQLKHIRTLFFLIGKIYYLLNYIYFITLVSSYFTYVEYYCKI